MRRLFGAVSLRSINRCFGGPPPPCGGTTSWRRLFGAVSLRSSRPNRDGEPTVFVGLGVGDAEPAPYDGRGSVTPWLMGIARRERLIFAMARSPASPLST
jgi:hypothetical protein